MKNRESILCFELTAVVFIAALMASCGGDDATEQAPSKKDLTEQQPEKEQPREEAPVVVAPKLKVIDEHMDNTGPFETPHDVTKSCLECHEDVGDDILMTRHWRWFTEKKLPNGETVQYGKTNVLNNYCIALDGNWPRCTSCHIGYGWKDNEFDFKNKENIDCLVCHDQTGTYKKFPTGAGYPTEEEKVFMGNKFLPPDYAKIAQNVGKATSRNCGTCHFNGGGGDGVKHGDLDSSLLKASRDLDVHMGGENFTCADCHTAEKHEIRGALYATAPMSEADAHFTCLDCHEDVKHKNKKINLHLAALGCETCHIPLYAKEIPTKTWWDWSTAGTDLKSGKDKFGMALWSKKKGTFKWGKELVPEYAWSNGTQEVYTKNKKIELTGDVLVLNKQLGAIADPGSRIMPFKIMRGKQPYDVKLKKLIVPKLFGEDGFWKTFDWEQSAVLGMKAAGLEYSGSLGWIETEMYWPIHHQVAPKSGALKCGNCHFKKGRMDWKALGYEGDPIKTGVRKTEK